MNKFTPWKVDTVADMIYVRTAKGWTICKITPDEDDMQNAQLIAAAPMMLDALEMVAEWNGDPDKYLNLDEVRAAIRAAKGERI